MSRTSWDDVKAERESSDESCMVCGVPGPLGHIEVEDPYGARVGRICSSHTLFEVIEHLSDAFAVHVIYDDPHDNPEGMGA